MKQKFLNIKGMPFPTGLFYPKTSILKTLIHCFWFFMEQESEAMTINPNWFMEVKSEQFRAKNILIVVFPQCPRLLLVQC